VEILCYLGPLYNTTPGRKASKLQNTRPSKRGAIGLGRGESPTISTEETHVLLCSGDQDFNHASTHADRASGGDVLVKISYKHDNRNHLLEIS
jgi:hypothetical protein